MTAAVGKALPKAVNVSTGEQDCAADQDICVIFAQYNMSRKEMIDYEHKCEKKTFNPGVYTLVRSDDADDSRVYTTVESQLLVVVSECASDMCNEYGKILHKYTLLDFEEDAKCELSTVLETDSSSAATVDSWNSTSENPSTQASKDVTSETEKPQDVTETEKPQSGGSFQGTSEQKTQNDTDSPAARSEDNDQVGGQSVTGVTKTKHVPVEPESQVTTTPKDSIAGMKPSMIILSFLMMINI